MLNALARPDLITPIIDNFDGLNVTASATTPAPCAKAFRDGRPRWLCSVSNSITGEMLVPTTFSLDRRLNNRFKSSP